MKKDYKFDDRDLATRIEDSERQQEIIKEVDRLLTEWLSLSTEEQIKRRNSLLSFNLPILSSEDYKLCIDKLDKAKIISKKEATKKVKEARRALGIDKDEENSANESIYPSNLRLITPAQDFMNEIAYVTVPLNLSIGNKVISVFYLITSNKEKVRLTDEELFRRGFYSKREPCPSFRWSLEGIENFLNDKVRIDIFEVFEEIKNLYLYYIDFGNEVWAKLMSCLTIATYFHRLFQSFPYLHLTGDIESGKTKTLTLTSVLGFNAELTFNSTPSYTIRAIHDNHATCCVDEAERLGRTKDENEQMVVSMYNAGYKKGAFCGKAEQIGNDKKWLPKQFEAFSPKIFASIKGLTFSLRSRCILITMLKSGNKDIKNREININDPIFQKIRDKLYSTMLTYHFLVKTAYEMLDDPIIVGRGWELWKPIFSIARIIDNSNENKANLYQEFRNFALEEQSLKREEFLEETITPKLLTTLKDFIEHNPKEEDFYSISDLIDCLKDSEEEAFSWLKDENKHNKGRWLGTALRKTGIVKGRAKQKKIENTNIKGFYIDPQDIERRLRSFDL